MPWFNVSCLDTFGDGVGERRIFSTRACCESASQAGSRYYSIATCIHVLFVICLIQSFVLRSTLLCAISIMYESDQSFCSEPRSSFFSLEVLGLELFPLATCGLAATWKETDVIYP